MSTRIIEESIDLRATPDEVWRALTDAEELTRWFAFTARTTPGVGGVLDLNWGEGINWPMVIRVWDPPRHIRVEDHWQKKGLERPGEKHELFIDYFIEPRTGGVTRLRVVHLGFSDEPSWDGLYDSTSCGWRCELGALRHYLEHWRGERREPLWISRPLCIPLDEAYNRLLGARGLALAPRDAEARRDAPATARWSGDAPGPVTVLCAKPGRMVVLVPASEPGALLMAGVEPPQDPAGRPCAMIRFNLYGGAGARAAALRSTWESALARLLG